MSSWFTRANAPFDKDRATNLVDIDGGPPESDYVDRRTGEWPSIHSRMGMWQNQYPTSGSFSANFDSVKVGTLPEFRHNFPIPGNDSRAGEIQSLVSPPNPYAESFTEAEQYQFVGSNGEYFYVD